jgi:hypothetical protein
MFRKMDGTEDYHAKKNKPDSERQTSIIFSYMQDLDFLKRHESRWKTEKNTSRWVMGDKRK